MKFIIAIALFVMSANALRKFDTRDVDFRDERSVSSYIGNTIQGVSQYIKDVGLDPLHIEKREYNYTLPVPVIFNCGFLIEELLSNGISDFLVHSANYNVFASRLSFDIELPLVNGSVGAASMATTVFGKTFKMNSSGKVEVKSMRFVGNIRLNIDYINTEISVRSAKVTFTMGGIESDVKLAIQDVDYSDQFNEFFNSTIPETFKAYRSEINELLGITLLHYASAYLNNH